MSDIASTLAYEMSLYRGQQKLIQKELTVADIYLQKVVSVSPSISEDAVGKIVYHREGIGYYFIAEADLKKNIQNILTDPSIVEKITGLRCKEDRMPKILETKSIVLEEYILRDPSTPDNIINPLF